MTNHSQIGRSRYPNPDIMPQHSINLIPNRQQHQYFGQNQINNSRNFETDRNQFYEVNKLKSKYQQKGSSELKVSEITTQHLISKVAQNHFEGNVIFKKVHQSTNTSNLNPSYPGDNLISNEIEENFPIEFKSWEKSGDLFKKKALHQGQNLRRPNIQKNQFLG